MERAHRAELSRLPGALLEAPFEVGSAVELDPDTVHHLRVRRLAVGDDIRLTNGVGAIGRAVITTLDRRRAAVEVVAVFHEPAPPSVRLLVPVGDRDRMLWLAEKATELSLARWTPVRWSRSRNVSPRGEGEAFRARVRARMAAALVQSAGAWLPVIEPEMEPAAIPLHLGAREQPRLVLDADGAPLLQLLARAAVSTDMGSTDMTGTDMTGTDMTGTDMGIVVVLGPEGGLLPEELAGLRGAGFHACSLGTHTLRFETAAVAALSILLAARSAGFLTPRPCES